ncbi:gluconokinase [Microbacterium terrisoli]|uniref:gluconokinase n=1 Tax=Microbacterium terrisoli TaxID=3242192 RepID=UPI002803B15E|nr:gluconokinase [Microbacterium protaetiae]
MIGDPLPPIVVMGVSASGKSSVGTALAARLGVPFVDGDDLHPRANVVKMASGVPLVDEDRWPWLDAVADRLAQGAVVVACSALKRAYRDRLRTRAPHTVFVHLAGSADVLERRIGSRPGHFMPPSLLQSQLDTLEPLGPDETGFVLDFAPSPAAVAQAALERLGAGTSGPDGL